MSTETLLREHFERAAEQVVMTPAPVAEIKGGVRKARMAIGFAATAAVVLAVAIVALTGRGADELLPTTPPADGESTSVEPTPSAAALAVFGSEIVSLLPSDFDPWNAATLHTQVGTPEFAARAYLESRLPGIASLGLEFVEVVDAGFGFSAVRWAYGDALAGFDDPSDGYFAGWVLTRGRAGTQDVIGATTDRIDLSRLQVSGGRITGEVMSTQIDNLALDLLTVDLEPIPGLPNPEGLAPDWRLFGSAGFIEGPIRGPVALPVDSASPGGRVVARVHLVGGTLLSVAEVAFGPSPVDEAMEILLRDAVPANEDGSIMLAAVGPEPQFDPPGEEQVLERGSEWEGLDLTMVPGNPDGPKPVGPFVYLGTLAGYSLVAFEATAPDEDPLPDDLGQRWVCVYEIYDSGSGGSCGVPDTSQIGWSGKGPGDGPGFWLITLGQLGGEASVVALETDSGTYWGRPVGGFVAFGVNLAGETLVKATVYDSSGSELRSTRFDPGS